MKYKLFTTTSFVNFKGTDILVCVRGSDVDDLFIEWAQIEDGRNMIPESEHQAIMDECYDKISQDWNADFQCHFESMADSYYDSLGESYYTAGRRKVE